MAHRLGRAAFPLGLTILCAPSLSAQEEVRVSPGTSLAGGASFGGPIGASLMLEVLYGPGADVRDDGDRVRGRVGGLFQAHAGSGGGKLSLGVGGRARIHTEDFNGPVSVGLKLSAARTWREPVGTAERLTYIGPELEFSVMRVAVSLGTLWRVDGPGGRRVLFSWGVGIRP